MKVKIECNSPLLKKSLNIFLKNYIDKDGIIIGDKQNCDIVIGKDIPFPFTKEQLISQINLLFKTKYLEKRIELLTNKFVQDLKNIIKESYEK